MESTNSGYNLPAQYEVLVCSSEQRLNGSRVRTKKYHLKNIRIKFDVWSKPNPYILFYYFKIIFIV